jgi:hypothetical protein
MIINKLFKQVAHNRHEQRKADLYRNLIRHEAKIGGQLFGAVPKDRRREFFCLDEHTWVWHEEWTDNSGQPHVQTTRYDIRPTGFFKAQGGQYQPLNEAETLRLYDAMNAYNMRVNREMYSAAR